MKTSQDTAAAASPVAPDKERWVDPAYNGKLIELTDDETGEEYAFKWPLPHHMSRFAREAQSEDGYKASRNLVQALLLFPARGDLESRCEERPGLWIALANEVNKKTGLTARFTAKN